MDLLIGTCIARLFITRISPLLAPVLEVHTQRFGPKQEQDIGSSIQRHIKLNVPYSRKFSLVQIFAQTSPDPSEEIFAVLIFAERDSSSHTPYQVIATPLP